MPIKVYITGCILFENLDWSRSIRAKRSTFLIKSDLLQDIWEKSGLATPICVAWRRCGLFTFKRAWSAALCEDDSKMTTPTTTINISVFFFTGLDRSRLTNLDRSTFVRYWKRMQPMYTAREWYVRRSLACGERLRRLCFSLSLSLSLSLSRSFSRSRSRSFLGSRSLGESARLHTHNN